MTEAAMNRNGHLLRRGRVRDKCNKFPRSVQRRGTKKNREPTKMKGGEKNIYLKENISCSKIIHSKWIISHRGPSPLSSTSSNEEKRIHSLPLSLLCSTIDNLVSSSNRNYEQSFLFFPPKKVGSSIEGIDREAKPPYIKLSFRHSPYNPEAGKPPLVRPRHCRCWPSFVTRLPPSLPSPTNNSPSYGSSPPRFGFSSEVELRGSSDCVHPCGTSNSSN